MLLKLINFDTKSLIGVLVWGNVATGIIVHMYQRFNILKTDYTKIRNMTIIRFLYAIGYLLLFLRGDLHDLISVNIGNSILFACQYMESYLLLEFVDTDSKKLNNILLTILIMGISTFNFVELIYRDASLRIGMASIIIFSIFLLPTIRLLIAKDASKFKRGISIFYIFLLATLITRSVDAFRFRSLSIHSNNYNQTLLFIAFIILMISNTVVHLLFMKERTDAIIEKMALTDALTSVLNRHSFLEQGKRIFEHHKSSRTCLAMLFFDIDHFKRVNDQFGHQFGDEVLTQFADLIKNSIRPNDLCCRYGGEEFIVLLTSVTESVSENIAIRILHGIESYSFNSHPDFHITTSIGHICNIPETDEFLEDYIQRADEAMYEAKKTGRNKLVTYGRISND